MKRPFLVLLLLTPAAHAEERVSFSGFVDVATIINTNRPTNHENFIPGTGTTGQRANELSINLAQVQWSRSPASDQPVGFTLALVAGEGTDVVHAGEPGGPAKFRHVYQASVTYRLNNGVVLEGGVYPSHIGVEGFYSKDNWNYTRSWLGEFSPYYQGGVKASYQFNPRWSGQVHLLNGWQIINDNNDGKAVGTQVAYSNGPLTASLNTFLGPELAGDDDSLRKFVDVLAFYKISDRLQIGAAIDLGAQEMPNTGDADWRGAGGYLRWTPDDRHAVAFRAERFSDPENGITGTPQRLREATLTYEFRPRPSVILKLETRYDDSETDVFFDRDDGRTDSQFIGLAGAVFTF